MSLSVTCRENTREIAAMLDRLTPEVDTLADAAGIPGATAAAILRGTLTYGVERLQRLADQHDQVVVRLMHTRTRAATAEQALTDHHRRVALTTPDRPPAVQAALDLLHTTDPAVPAARAVHCLHAHLVTLESEIGGLLMALNDKPPAS